MCSAPLRLGPDDHQGFKNNRNSMRFSGELCLFGTDCEGTVCLLRVIFLFHLEYPLTSTLADSVPFSLVLSSLAEQSDLKTGNQIVGKRDCYPRGMRIGSIVLLNLIYQMRSIRSEVSY